MDTLNTTNSHLSGPCPLCGAAKERLKAGCFQISKDDLTFVCYKCLSTGNIIDLYKGVVDKFMRQPSPTVWSCKRCSKSYESVYGNTLIDPKQNVCLECRNEFYSRMSIAAESFIMEKVG